MKKRVLGLLLLGLIPVMIGIMGQTVYHDAVKELANTFLLQNTFNLGTVQGPVLFANLGSVPTTTGASVVISDGKASGSTCVGGGTGVPAVYVNGAWNCAAGGLAPSSPGQVGDILRFNVNGDNAWDTVNDAPDAIQLWANPFGGGGTNDFFATSPWGTGGTASTTFIGAGGGANAGPPITSPYFLVPNVQLQSGSSASTSTLIAAVGGTSGGNQGNIPISGVYRITSRIRIDTLSNIRVWTGWAVFHNGSGNGNNGLHIENSTGMASDTPAKTFVAFRYSAGVDTTWQAVSSVQTGSTSQTIVDTHVTVDGNIHLYEIVQDYAGANLFFFIDHVLVATITTNIPTGTTGDADSGEIFWVGDNKNTANVIKIAWWKLHCSLRF